MTNTNTDTDNLTPARRYYIYKGERLPAPTTISFGLSLDEAPSQRRVKAVRGSTVSGSAPTGSCIVTLPLTSEGRALADELLAGNPRNVTLNVPDFGTNLLAFDVAHALIMMRRRIKKSVAFGACTEIPEGRARDIAHRKQELLAAVRNWHSSATELLALPSTCSLADTFDALITLDTEAPR